MTRCVRRLLVAALVLATSSTLAFAQATTTLSGVVTDSAGGVIPGATVVVTNNTTGTTFEAVTGTSGVYTVAAVQAGTYTVTAALSGFKTAQVSNVRVAVGVPTTANLKLEVGQLTETVNVSSSTELVNTQTATVTATLNSDQLNRMPTPTRNALNAVAFLPGVNTATTNRNSSINGLPDSFVQITMDGASNNDNYLRSSDGFFASVTPRQDAVEAVTVTMAAAGANLGGSGAVTIAFQTRSGGNRFSGSLYEYFRDPRLNSNYYFNEVNGLPKNEVKLHQYGGRIGGPVILPGFDGRGKMFYFLNYEQIRFPNTFTRTRNVTPSRFLDGWMRYEVSGGNFTEINVLDVARNNGFADISMVDPTVMTLLRNIEAATMTTGVINTTNDPVVNQYVWQSPGNLFEHQPTARVDYNLTDRHRLSGTMAIIWAERDPDYLNGADARFPGAPNYRKFTSKRPLYTLTLRSTLSQNVVNELTGNLTALGGESSFGSMESNGPQTFEDMGGYALVIPIWTDWWTTNAPSWRSSPTYRLANTTSWQRGNHSLSFGLDWQRATASASSQNMVPGVNLGFNTALDPTAGLFNNTNFPGASTGDLSDARALYAMLTGRVTAITGTANLDPDSNKYVAYGPVTREGFMNTFSGFVSDQWRATPTLTITAGVRYDLQMPFTPTNDIMTTVLMEDACGISGLGSGGVYNRCNFFQPGASGGKEISEYTQLIGGTKGYNVDYNNFSPSISLAWRPNVQSGVLRTILGNPDTATLRAGYSMSYAREGLSTFVGQFSSNPGSSISINNTTATGLGEDGGPWPILFSQRDRIKPATFNETPSFPIITRPNRQDSLSAFAPEIEVGKGQTWTVGLQRSIGQDMAIEVRYLGTRGSDQWSELNYNGIRGESLLNNGFLDEFKLAMANLQANNAAGGSRAGSFRYFGPGTGTNPLPIYLAHFNARADANNAAAYSGSSWTSATFVGRLAKNNANPTGAAGDLEGNSSRRANARAAGLPANFFIPNPRVNAVNVIDSGAFSDYHALQIELRRRLSRGLSANVNYQYAIEGGSAFDGFSFGRTMVSSANVRHAFKGQWDWTIPVGRGQRFGADMHPVLDAILGGWSMNGVGRVQARVMNFGNVRLVGMDVDELTDMYKFYRTTTDSGQPEIRMLPADVILNTRRAFSTSATSLTGYGSLGVPEGRYIAPANHEGCFQIVAGDCAPRTTLVRAPWFTRIDVGVTKRFNLRGTMNLEVRGDVLNLFDNINFNPTANPGTSANIFRVTSAYTDASNTYDPGGRLGQLMIRFNW